MTGVTTMVMALSVRHPVILLDVEGPLNVPRRQTVRLRKAALEKNTVIYVMTVNAQSAQHTTISAKSAMYLETLLCQAQTASVVPASVDLPASSHTANHAGQIVNHAMFQNKNTIMIARHARTIHLTQHRAQMMYRDTLSAQAVAQLYGLVTREYLRIHQHHQAASNCTLTILPILSLTLRCNGQMR